MFLRNALVLSVCLILAVVCGYVYHVNAYVVWGLLAFCWICYRLKMRADTLFGARSAATAPVRVSSDNPDASR